MNSEDSTTHKTVVFGYYGIGNFGDDLMGWMFARHLESLGSKSVLFSLSDSQNDSLSGRDFTEWSIGTSRSIDEVLDGSRAAVYGGGGLLVKRAYRKRRRSKRYFEKTTILLDEIQNRKIPLALISVGGDGAESSAQFSPLAKRAVSYASLITTRNQSDTQLLSREGIPSRYLPDIVWSASAFGATTPNPSIRRGLGDCSAPLRIGVDLYTSNVVGKGLFRFVSFLYSLAWFRSHVELVVFNSKHVSCGRLDAMRTVLGGAATEHYRFQKFDLDFAKIASLDLLLSSRLHVPIVALQLGIPVISVFSESKTKMFFDAVGLSDSFYAVERMSELRSLLSSQSALYSWIESYSFPDIATLCSGAFGHFQALEEFTQSNCARTKL